MGTAVPIFRAAGGLRRILWDSGPPILKTLTAVGQEARLQLQPGPDDKSGPHFEGRALDIMLHAERANEFEIGENLREFLLNRQDEIRWSLIIYFKRQWTSLESMTPRVGTKGRDFEHKTHIHIEWSQNNRDKDDFKASMKQDLEIVFGPNPYD